MFTTECIQIKIWHWELMFFFLKKYPFTFLFLLLSFKSRIPLPNYFLWVKLQCTGLTQTPGWKLFSKFEIYETSVVSQYFNIFIPEYSWEGAQFISEEHILNRIWYYSWFYSLSKATVCCKQYYINHHQKAVSKDTVNLKLCLEKPYLQHLINKMSSDWIP